MKPSVLESILGIWVLYVLQIAFVFKGRDFSNPESGLNPLMITCVSFGIVGIYFYVLRKAGKTPFSAATENKGYAKWIGWALGMAAIALCYEEFRKMFIETELFSNRSDVMTQLYELYDRFDKGIFPYTEVIRPHWGHRPFPVYMPLHWLPIGIPYHLGIDIRWIGFGVLGIAMGLYGYHLCKQYGISFLGILAIFLPSSVYWAFWYYELPELALTLETLIGAYYVILAVGLWSKNIYLTALGVILCLLSRYTFLFWLPLFAILMWQNESKKQNFIFWGSVALAVLVGYVFPFWMKDPTIFATGVKYHNGCAVAEWVGFGKPSYSYTFTLEIYFGQFLRDHLPAGKDMEARVGYARLLQLSCMALLNLVGYYFYQKWKSLIEYRDFLLGMLFLFIFVFYIICPLVYLYYYFMMLLLSSLLVAKMMMVYAHPAKP